MPSSPCTNTSLRTTRTPRPTAPPRRSRTPRAPEARLTLVDMGGPKGPLLFSSEEAADRSERRRLPKARVQRVAPRPFPRGRSGRREAERAQPEGSVHRASVAIGARDPPRARGSGRPSADIRATRSAPFAPGASGSRRGRARAPLRPNDCGFRSGSSSRPCMRGACQSSALSLGRERVECRIAPEWRSRVTWVVAGRDQRCSVEFLDDGKTSVLLDDAFDPLQLMPRGDQEVRAVGSDRFVLARRDVEYFCAGDVAAFADEEAGAVLAPLFGKLCDPLVHLSEQHLVLGCPLD